MSIQWDIVSTPGAYHDWFGGYHEYNRGCAVHRGDIMSTLGVISRGTYFQYTRVSTPGT